jgi:hypothetical protein
VDHACLRRPQIAGTLLPDEHPGDCKLLACGAEGVVEEREAPADTPPPTDPCWQPVCRGGLPDRSPSPAGQRCGELGLCFRDGACRVVRQIASGDHHSCVLLSDGTISCWGGNLAATSRGGPEELTKFTLPERLAARDKLRLLAVGGQWVYATTEKDETLLWHLETTYSTERPHSEVIFAGEKRLSGTVALAGSAWLGCALDAAGAVRCWGARTGPTQSEPVSLPGRAIQLVGNDSRVCALLGSGAVHCWEQEATATAVEHHQRVSSQRVGQVAGATSLAVGLLSYCVTRADSTVWCWGTTRHRRTSWSNDRRETPEPGEIVPSIREREIRQPTQIAGLGEVISIAASDRRTCALQRGGAVLCWGQRGYFLPAGPGMVSSPVALAGFTGVTSLTMGPDFLCTLRQGGEVVCAGNNARGQLAQGDREDASAREIPF